jgi:hypothetical protein
LLLVEEGKIISLFQTPPEQLAIKIVIMDVAC